MKGNNLDFSIKEDALTHAHTREVQDGLDAYASKQPCCPMLEQVVLGAG